MKKIILSLVLVGLVSVTSVQAEESVNLKPKSTGLVAVLGFDPIPGDALFYAGKPVQGTISLVLGGASAVPFFLFTFADCGDLCGAFHTIGLISGIPYFATLIWDFIGGTSGVREHNERVAKQTTWLQTIQPTLAVTDQGAMAGFQVKF